MRNEPWYADRRARVSLAILAVLGLVTAWWLYPTENRYSILRCTISFLGSPDANRNPDGWRFYQAGMTCLSLVLFSLAAERHVHLRRRIGRTVFVSSAALFLALLMLLAVTWIPDTKQGQWFGMTTGKFHTRIAILSIPVMGFGIAVDALALWLAGVRFLALWPIHLYGLLVAAGITQLVTWERMCRADPSLPHWPGQGLYSTPLWEWIVFTYFIGFMIWMARVGCRLQPGRREASQTNPEASSSPG